MKEPKYGTMKKKVVFYDSDKRYAELKIRLKYHSLTQSQFFRGLVTGYLSGDENIMNFLNNLRTSSDPDKNNKNRIKKDAELFIKGKQTLNSTLLEGSELENIFDILEKQNPDL
tara:strand:- start:302 stop:643 length:342 start_codon:yes stop_codon:yes gene_type:complete